MNIYCPNCENECSEAAVSCPRCGHPLTASAVPVSESLTICPSCRAAVGVLAATCPGCGHQLVRSIKQSADGAPRATDPFFWPLLTIVVIGFCIFILWGDDIFNTNHTERGAHAITKQFVEDRLSSPATADWPWKAKEIKYMGEGIYRVRTYVDSQNGFGALMRSDVDAVVKWTAGDWKLVSLSVE